MDRPELEHSAKEDELDFCGDPDTARAKFKEGAAAFLSNLLPMKDAPGYLDFVKQIVVDLVTSVNDANTQMTPQMRVEIFLKCYLIAEIDGMKDRKAEVRLLLDCFVGKLMLITDYQKMAEATFDLIHSIFLEREESSSKVLPKHVFGTNS